MEDRLLGLVDERMAGIRHLDGLSVSQKELKSEPRFKLEDLLAQRGLNNVPTFCGSGKIPILRECHGGLQETEIGKIHGQLQTESLYRSTEPEECALH